MDKEEYSFSKAIANLPRGNFLHPTDFWLAVDGLLIEIAEIAADNQPRYRKLSEGHQDVLRQVASGLSKNMSETEKADFEESLLANPDRNQYQTILSLFLQAFVRHQRAIKNAACRAGLVPLLSVKKTEKNYQIKFFDPFSGEATKEISLLIIANNYANNNANASSYKSADEIAAKSHLENLLKFLSRSLEKYGLYCVRRWGLKESRTSDPITELTNDTPEKTSEDPAPQAETAKKTNLLPTNPFKWKQPPRDWREITMRVKDNNTISVKINKEIRSITPSDLNLAHKTSGNGTRAWEMLIYIIGKNGRYDSTHEKNRETDRKNIGKLRAALTAFFSCANDPIPCNAHLSKRVISGYTAQFTCDTREKYDM